MSPYIYIYIYLWTHCTDDPQLDFLTIVAVEAVREKRNLIVRENYWLFNLGTIFKGINSKKDLNSVLSSSSR